MKKNEGLIMNVGTASIILVLLVFILSMFGVLSIKASNHELRLAEKLGASVKEYYDADALGQRMLAEIDTIVQIEANNSTGDTFIENVTKKVKDVQDLIGSESILSVDVEAENIQLKQISYVVAVREKAKLMVTLGFDEDNQYTIENWSVWQEALGEYELDGLEEFEDIENIESDEEIEDGTQQIPANEEIWDGIIDPSLVE